LTPDFAIAPQFAYNMESPQHEQTVGSSSSTRFNFNMGYQLDSEVVYAYFGYSENLVYAIERKKGLFKPPLPFEQRHQDVQAAWVANNCKSSNNREQAVQSIMNAGMKVDSFGGCIHNKDFPSGHNDTEDSLVKLLSRYKFYLSFENSICRHYYTEKLFRCFEAGVIPILLGHPADIEYFLPHQVGNMSLTRLSCNVLRQKSLRQKTFLASRPT
jgi:alpha-1,3-fucosyltransferase